MNAELLKFRLMALPRWSALAAFGVVLLTGALLAIFPRADGAAFIGVMDLVTDYFVELVAIVIGAWAATLEFSSGTLQRTLTAQADRTRVLAAKLAVVVGAVALLGLAAAFAGGGLVDLAAHQNGVPLDRGDLARALLSTIPGAVTSAVIGFGLGLLTRSVGGAVTVALMFIYVLAGVLSFVPRVNDLMYSKFETDLGTRIAGSVPADADIHSLPVALLGVLAWAALLIIPGWILFQRADLK